LIITCPKCQHVHEVNEAAELGKKGGSAKSAAKSAAAKLNASKPRPNAKGKPKPRKVPSDIIREATLKWCRKKGGTP
jgi:hypothetical protein